MKKYLLILGTMILISCGKNKGEQMLYKYQQENFKSLNIDLKDLDFKIKKVERVGDITASDSLRIIEENFLPAKFWENVTDSTDEAKLTTIRYIGIGKGMSESTIENLLKIGKQYIRLSKSPDAILSSKYRATYTLKNPILNITQTFDDIFYTNIDQTEFVRKEAAKDE